MLTGRDIGERFIRSAQIIGSSTERVGPRAPGSAWMDTVYTQAEKNGWGSERLADERKAFWNALNRSAKPWEITEAEETQGWLRFVPNKGERICLLGWAECMAGKRFFKDWCRSEKIHEETGRRRKERAILKIMLALDCNPLQHNENAIDVLLPADPVLGDKSVILTNDAPTSWMAPDAKATVLDFDEDLRDFSWSEKQNERRRQRETQARKKQAA